MFIIKDSGKGMEQESLNKLIKLLKEGDSSQGYGLSNVNERLKLYFGVEYGLNIESVKDCHTTVIVNIPIVEREDQYV
jgi:two-component system sensor histidine kinase YesM